MVFKKPFRELKTSAPLRSSDRRKLRARVAAQYPALDAEQADLLVPEGIQLARFVASTGEQGTLYTSGGEPIWFSLGRAGDREAEDVLPSVYTLWKVPNLVPSLYTPDAVLPILMGGADLMIPGVHTSRATLDPLISGTIVAVRNIGLGRMVVSGVDVRPGRKGKAARVLHVVGDALWEMGSKADPPPEQEEPFVTTEDPEDLGAAVDAAAATLEGTQLGDASGVQEEPPTREVAATDAPPRSQSLSPQEVDAFLRIALLLAIRSVPRTALPMSTSNFYSSYILPSRPIASSAGGTPADIKHSSYKSLGAFLKLAEKDGLLRLKGDNVTTLNAAHQEVAGLGKFKTTGEADAKAKKREAEEKARDEQVRPLEVVELWKPHGASTALFEDAGADAASLYSAVQLRSVVNGYLAAKQLQNAHEQQYINIPEGSAIQTALDNKKDPIGEHCRRDEALRRLQDNMQTWHSLDGVVRKGALKPVNITSKFRQGKRPVTLITNFEPYGLDADWLGEELRRTCAGATSVSPLPGKSAGKEVLVQGKQIKPAIDFLLARGIPKRWIETADLTEKK
ncbi:hypothetical protein AURDEDRAFT_88886 [Auricularia subglabra TFB-10046 SS5]|nr:hypothetical protein AURDEDRAFT_88886 [Auricularia subglabra TFB-10046 SS5]